MKQKRTQEVKKRAKETKKRSKETKAPSKQKRAKETKACQGNKSVSRKHNLAALRKQKSV
jgi:hypothetical protein